MVSRTVKEWLRALLPRGWRADALVRRDLEYELSDRIVKSGPFVGMHYASRGMSSAYYPKLLGTYELELHTVVEDIVALVPELIVDVGAAEGYYAVGLARRVPLARIVCFEALGDSLLKEMAQLNHVGGRLETHGLCDVTRLRAALSNAAGRTVVIMDVEGGEVSLLDPTVIPELENAHVLVEMHDLYLPGATEHVAAKFHRTHVIEHVAAMPRVPSDYPLPMRQRFWFRSEYYYTMFLGERPLPMGWLWMKPQALVK